ncbi:hypothetical protein D3C81_1225590 [compost metagenome]
MNDLAPRESVWLALSELWLDTELDDVSYDYIARTLATSGFPLPELEAIYRQEVVPSVYTNGLSVAGEWAGFNADWLFGECRRNQQKRASALHRCRCWLLRRTVGALMDSDWLRIEARVIELRKND